MIVNTYELLYLESYSPVESCINMELMTLHFCILSILEFLAKTSYLPNREKLGKTGENFLNKFVWIDD